MDHRFLIPAVLFVLSLALRSVYELLKEARRIDPENRVIFAGIFSAMVVLWMSWISLCTADPVRVDLPDGLRWAGLGVFVIGTILAVGALAQLGGVENIDHLVTTGLFKRIRHPMYAGFISWFLGWSTFHGAGVSFALGLIGVASVLWWRQLEERRLETQFGSAYRQYRRTTWF